MSNRRPLSSRRRTTLSGAKRGGAGIVGLALGGIYISACLSGGPAQAQTAATTAPPPGPLVAQTAPQESAAAGPLGSGGFFNGMMQRSTLLGDIGGLRPFLNRFGISFNLQETSEVMGNVSGGIKLGTTYDGLTTMGLTARHPEGPQLGGRHVQHQRPADPWPQPQRRTTSPICRPPAASRRIARRGCGNCGTSRPFSTADRRENRSAEPRPGIHQQPIRRSVRQHHVRLADGAVGGSVSGGPAYPLSSPGVRLRGRPTGTLTLLAGIFNDNPAGPGSGDPQLRNASGTNFRLSDSPLVIAEMQYSINQPALGEMDYGDRETGLPGTYSLGAWYNDGLFADQRVRQFGPLARRPRQQRQCAAAPGQFQYLRRHRPADLASGADELQWDRGVHARDGRPWRPQPDHLQPQCRRDVRKASFPAATTTRSASVSAMPESAAASPIRSG